MTITTARRTDPATSYAAANQATPHAREDVRASVLRILADGPLTDDDIFDLYVIGGGRRTAQRVRTARSELVKKFGQVRRAETPGRSHNWGASDRWELAQ